MAKVHSVSEITQVIKRTLESSFPYISVKGEVTNLTRASSGHIYFSIKDENALLPCVWYKHQQKDISFDPNTGEVFDKPIPSLAKSMQQGMEILFSGSLNVYPPRGAYQFIIDTAEEAGKGNLHKAFEELKKKLFALGLFDEKHKKELPKNPKKVAILTSPQGAVVHDFCRIARQYGMNSKFHIYPIAVQGMESAPSIVSAIQRVNKEKWADIIVLIRGGGSLEDLFSFNEEIVARAIFDSKIPLITGIGHQVDITIADYVADKSAATPSHVVSHLWNEKKAYTQYIDELETKLTKSIENTIEEKAESFDMQKLNQAMLNLLDQKTNTFNYLSRSLSLLSPAQKVHAQAALLINARQRLRLFPTQTLLAQAEKLKNLQERLHTFKDFIKPKKHELMLSQKNLSSCMLIQMQKLEQEVQKSTAILEAHNPYAPLEKGYALIHSIENNKETLALSAKDLLDKEEICLEFKDSKARITKHELEII